MVENGQENGASAEKRKAEDAANGDSGAKKEKLEGGTLLFSGATDWKLVGRKNADLPKSANTQWSPVRLEALKDVNIVGVNKGCASPFCLVIDEEGQVWAWGRNENGQLGLGNTKDKMVPTLVQELTGYNITEIATGKGHSLFLTSCGKVFAAGDNEKGQCGQGKKSGNLETPKQISHEGAEIVSVAAGAEFSVILDKDGKVWTFGLPENGTLGHNDDGKFIARANKVEFRCEYAPKQVTMFVDKDSKTKEVTPLDTPKIVKISCGPQHTVVVDDNNKAYSWGFGGYGRLGHSETADELVTFISTFQYSVICIHYSQVPRQIQALSGKNRGVKDVVCGATFTVGLCEIEGMCNMWGIYTTNKEANMYPKPIQDLSGWNTRSLACNTKVGHY